MKIFRPFSILFLALLVFLPVSLMAADFQDRMRLADSLVEKKQDPDSLKKAQYIYMELVRENPQSYEANWKVTKAVCCYNEYHKFNMNPNYSKIAAESGKLGLDYAGRAMAINPDGIEGIFWYALSAGAYAEGASILTALKEGLKGKFERNFLKVYARDKSYWNYYTVLALGEFYYSLPWPMNDNKKALRYLEELYRLNPSLDEGRLFLARALLTTSKAADRERAKGLLMGITNSNIKFFRAQSRNDLKKEFNIVVK